MQVLDAHKQQIDATIRQVAAAAEEARMLLQLTPLEQVSARAGVEQRLTDARIAHTRVAESAVAFRGVRVLVDSAAALSAVGSVGSVVAPPPNVVPFRLSLDDDSNKPARGPMPQPQAGRPFPPYGPGPGPTRLGGPLKFSGGF